MARIMNIAKITHLGLNYPIYKKQQNINETTFNVRMSSPLNRDTVSFAGTPKGAAKTMEVTYDTALIAHNEAKKFQARITKGIKNIWEDLIATENEPNNPITYIVGRPKSPVSIQEKSGSRQWFSVEEILNFMEDLNGVKIVFRDPQRSIIDSALERLIPLIKSRKVRIHEIENKRPAEVKGLPEHQASVYDYGSVPILEKLIRIQEEVLNGKNIIGKKQTVRHNLTDDYTDANYCAIHMIMEFIGRSSRVFELQIMGNDMAIGKDVDDLIYKILSGKQVPKQYAKIVNILKPLAETSAAVEEIRAADESLKKVSLQTFIEMATDEEWKNELETLNKFNIYRKKVMLFQRSKGAKPFSIKKIKERFLPLDSDINPELDFNNLYDLKEEADHKEKVVALKKAAKERMKTAVDDNGYYY